ncbi:Ig domain-containing protein [Variovorax sp. J22P271]|uniref:Ig domain-containing protein n=1 Tax=Variovorax davisae TaxID=3053515 RepID=UPI002574C19F|nr:Ig domain-containing protein [Variovorax sp. J22P271]MDM0032052.1 Ig domain-containing protein [Variovorax sp. J22P271]
MAFLRASLLVVLAFMSACGGGGSAGGGGSTTSGGVQTLQVGLTWPNRDVYLFKDSVVMPAFFGFDGHAPICVATAGKLPAGMVLGSNCAIVGRPTEPGSNFNISIRVGASGVSNTIQSTVTVRVLAPSARYMARTMSQNAFSIGETVNDVVTISGWEAPADAEIAWVYTLKSGALPPGLTLNANTGAVVGTTTSVGSFSAEIGARMSTKFGAYETVATYAVNVGVPGFGYVNTGGTGQSLNGMNSYIGQPFSAEVSLSATAPAGSILKDFAIPAVQLPAGLTIDPATGRIAGTPTTTSANLSILVKATIVTPGGASNPTQTNFGVSASRPILIRHVSSTVPVGTVGTPISLNPIITAISSLPLTAPTYNYAKQPGPCSLPTGVSIDPATGVVSGTPGTAGNFICYLDITITNAGISWLQQSTLLTFAIR